MTEKELDAAADHIAAAIERARDHGDCAPLRQCFKIYTPQVREVVVESLLCALEQSVPKPPTSGSRFQDYVAQVLAEGAAR
jgi:hypothetical protein